jgi:hypothetical protein
MSLAILWPSSINRLSSPRQVTVLRIDNDDCARDSERPTKDPQCRRDLVAAIQPQDTNIFRNGSDYTGDVIFSGDYINSREHFRVGGYLPLKSA